MVHKVLESIGVCKNCGLPAKRKSYIFCSNRCQNEYQYKNYIEQWKKGNISGIVKLGIVSKHIKRYLREKFKNKCCLCGWSKVNLYIGKAPLVADHIDGDWRNNTESNLRLLCPNCDSLLPTFGGLNRGKGRNNRKISKRGKEARLIIKAGVA